MRLASLLELHAAVEVGKAGGCRYDFGRVFVPGILARPFSAFGVRDRARGGVRMGELAGLLAGIWRNLREGRLWGQLSSKRAPHPWSEALSKDGRSDKGCDKGYDEDPLAFNGSKREMFRRILAPTDAAKELNARERLIIQSSFLRFLARPSKGGVMAALLVDWVVVLAVIGGAFTGLGLAGLNAIEPRRVSYEQGKAARVAEQGETVFRRDCLVRREFSSRLDPKMALVAVRWPLQPPGALPALRAEGGILAATLVGQGLASPVPNRRSLASLAGGPNLWRPAQPTSGILSSLRDSLNLQTSLPCDRAPGYSRVSLQDQNLPLSHFPRLQDSCGLTAIQPPRG